MEVVNMSKILIIDDDPEFTMVLEDVLTETDEVLVCNSGSEIMGLDWQPDIVLLDWWLGGETAQEVGQIVKQRWQEVPIIVMSSDKEVHRMSKSLGVKDVLIKPFQIQQLLQAVQSHS
jgi:DNA-binding response OmpR family regulator